MHKEAKCIPIAKPPVVNPTALVPASLEAIKVKLRYTQLSGMLPPLMMRYLIGYSVFVETGNNLFG